MTQSGHSALLTNVVADDAAEESGFRLPHLPRRQIDTAGAPVPLPDRFSFFLRPPENQFPVTPITARGVVLVYRSTQHQPEYRMETMWQQTVRITIAGVMVWSAAFKA